MSDSEMPEDEGPLPPVTFVPHETPTGTRYRLSQTGRVKGVGLVVRFCLWGVAAVAAALALAVYLLATYWEELREWRAAVALLYPLQLALDLAATGRFTWRIALLSLGKLEVELTGAELRAGRRWGRVWHEPQSVPLANLQRLVIVQRPSEVGSGTDWDLMAERRDGPPVIIVSSYDEPELIWGLARDLHRRLADGPLRGRDWPPLVEEDGPPRPAEIRSPQRPLVPGGPWGWLIVHGAGALGLGTLLLAVRQGAQRPPWHLAALVMACILEFLIFLFNWAYFKATQSQPRS
jgi:hypothetical protein